jgi:ABC-type transporter Mla subunit MlaD
VSDTFNLSGDFRGAILNIKSTLRDVEQTVGDIRTQDGASKAELQQLIQQLSEALEKAPPQQAEAAQAVAETAKSLVDQAAAAKPNKTMLQITGEGLKQAAQNLADVMPTVLTIATQIVATVARLKT